MGLESKTSMKRILQLIVIGLLVGFPVGVFIKQRREAQQMKAIDAILAKDELMRQRPPPLVESWVDTNGVSGWTNFITNFLCISLCVTDEPFIRLGSVTNILGTNWLTIEGQGTNYMIKIERQI